MENFIKSVVTYQGVGLAPHDIFNDPDDAWVSKVTINPKNGKQPRTQYFFGSTEQESESMGKMFVNGIECHSALVELRNLFETSEVIDMDKVNELLNTAK